jgi:hypothetical protein
MSDDDLELDTDYSFDDDASLEPDQKNAGRDRQEWFKFGNKGQMIRAAFVYLYTLDANAVQKAMKDAGKAGKRLSREETVAVAKAALTKRAQDLGKSVDQLSAIERLDTTVAHFKSLKAHFHDDVGYVISRYGKDGPDADLVWKKIGPVKSYFTTLLLIYPTDSEGSINKEALANQVHTAKLKLVPWRFSGKTYDEIYGCNEGLRDNGLSLASQDVKITCDNPKFQGVKVVAAGPATWQRNEKMKAAVLTGALNLYDKLNPFREMTTDQLREKLGIGGGSSSSDEGSGGVDASADNFNDMLSGV